VLRRWLHGRPGTGLVIVNAVLRATALGLAGCLALAGLLGPSALITTAVLARAHLRHEGFPQPQ